MCPGAVVHGIMMRSIPRGPTCLMDHRSLRNGMRSSPIGQDVEVGEESENQKNRMKEGPTLDPMKLLMHRA